MLHKAAKEYATRPSEMFGLEGGWLCWCFDRAVNTYGSRVDTLLQQTKTQGRGKSQKTVPKYTVDQALQEALSRGKGVKAPLLEMAAMELEKAKKEGRKSFRIVGRES